MHGVITQLFLDNVFIPFNHSLSYGLMQIFLTFYTCRFSPVGMGNFLCDRHLVSLSLESVMLPHQGDKTNLRKVKFSITHQEAVLHH